MATLNNITKSLKIRKGKICPFLTKCGNKSTNCPKKGNTYDIQFSCGFVKLFTITEQRRVKGEYTVQTAEKVVAPLPDIIVVVEAKQNERYKGQSWVSFSVSEMMGI